MLISVHPETPEARKISQIVGLLEKGACMVYPTDSVYGLGCLMNQTKAIDKICALRGLDKRKVNLTLVCKDLQQISQFCHQLDKTTFKLLKKHLPGPFTFILKSTKALPKSLQNRKQTLGFRHMEQSIVSAILNEVDVPLLSISFKTEDEVLEYPNDPIEIHDVYGNRVDFVIDGGLGKLEVSTVVDFSKGDAEVIREGLGEFNAS